MHRVKSAQTIGTMGVKRALFQLRQLVQARGLKSSSVREAIAEAALRQPGHFSVEVLVAQLHRAGFEAVHPATVYRVLPLLVEAGLLRLTLMSDQDGTRYERAFEREHHDHLICTRCGKVVEFCFEAIEVLQQDLCARFGFHLTGHIHELLGICKECRAVHAAT